jgi:hypothetical protein
MDEFHKHANTLDKKMPYCKLCNIEKSTLWNKENKEKRSISIRKHNYKKRYGLTVEQKQAMIDDQDGLCAICKIILTKTHDVCVDHNHTTKAIRGILCRKCNLGIGHLNDSVQILENAVQYLNQHSNEEQ